MQKRLPKYRRAAPSAELPKREITDRSVAIIAALVRYRFLPTSLLTHIVPGNARITNRHLQSLYHAGLVNRFAFPRVVGNPGEFQYYLDNREALVLLADAPGLELTEDDYTEVRRNREKNYAGIYHRKKAEDLQGQLLFLQHELMISRFHAMIELACRNSGGKVELVDWQQGSGLWNKVDVPKIGYDRENGSWHDDTGTVSLPHRPDAFFTLHFPNDPEGRNKARFFYEADRERTSTKKFNMKLRAHFQFIAKQKRVAEVYGVNRIRAVLIETLTSKWGEELRSAAAHPIVSGQPSPLFWFTVSELFGTSERPSREKPAWLRDPSMVFNKIWASPVDDTLYSLMD